MKILFEHPSKVSWHLYRVTVPGKPAFILTGWYGGGTDAEPEALRRLLSAGGRAERIGNVVVDMAVRVTGYGRGRSAVRYFVADRDGGVSYELGASAMMELLKGLQDGRLRLENGHVVGRFTFKKQGQEIYLHPYDGPEAAGAQFGDANGAVDVSDLVAALPRTSGRS